MNLDTLYATLLNSIQEIALYDDRLDEDEYEKVLNAIENVKKLLVKQ